MPVRLILTQGTTADCSQGISLIHGIEADRLLADKGYDTNEIVAAAVARGINPVILPKSNRREPRDYDRDLYKLRHLREVTILVWRLLFL
jgi:transposase